jgi:sec-independent protein translocase protein TatA
MRTSMFENIGFPELMLIMLVIVIFFGPKKIPEFAKSLGKGIAEFKRAMRDVQTELTKPENTPLEKPAEPPASKPK